MFSVEFSTIKVWLYVTIEKKLIWTISARLVLFFLFLRALLKSVCPFYQLYRTVRVLILIMQTELINVVKGVYRGHK